jgi:hypothetical protein
VDVEAWAWRRGVEAWDGRGVRTLLIAPAVALLHGVL